MSIEEAETFEALQRLVSDGSDLSRPMSIDFFVAVPDKKAGVAVADRVAGLGFVASVEQDEETGEWTCYCSRTIVPDLSTVVAIERQLDSIGREFGGHGDGFGSYGNAEVTDRD